MPGDKTASGEARRLRRREAKLNRQTRIILAVCGAVIVLCLGRYFPSAQRTTARDIFAVLGTVIYLCSFSNLVSGSWTIGMFPPAVAGAFAVCAASLYDIVTRRPVTVLSALLMIALAAAGVFVLIFALLFIVIFAGSLRTPKKGEPVTLVVLGCRLKGTEPGRMLRRRLDAAVKFLGRSGDTKCIVSGGRGDDEEATEAGIMYEYLIGKGIAPGRVFQEDASASTYENIRFSKEIAKRENLPMCFAVASDRFHQFRARLICRDNGIASRSVNAETAPYLALQFWSREAMCILEKYFKRL